MFDTLDVVASDNVRDTFHTDGNSVVQASKCVASGQQDRQAYSPSVWSSDAYVSDIYRCALEILPLSCA